ncbi:TraB/GumN family protein [Candidatus Woesearchaeota archaeon]|nr:TraB/GumN family protein [Candidatus Woesearchaeota archaeon]
MLQYNNLMIIGTSHIAKQSIEEVKNSIDAFKPDIIAIELDAKRAYALLNKNQKVNKKYLIKRIGLTGFLFAVLGEYAEKKLGEIVNIEPGEEMLTALKLSKKNNIKVALIDQDIEITLKRLAKKITWREKFNFIIDLISGILFKRNIKKFDLNKVPPEDIIKNLINFVKKRYPNIYLVLVKERNEYMANKLAGILKNEPDKKILAVIGAGHSKDICDLLKEKA